MEEKSEKVSFKAGVEAVWEQLRPFKRDIVIISIFGVISAIANGLVPYVTGKFFDALIAVSNGTSMDGLIPVWAFLLMAWVIVQATANVVSWLLDRRRRRVDTDVHFRIQSQGFIHLFLLPVSFHKNERINGIIDSISQGSWRIAAIVRTVANVAPQFASVIIGALLAYSIHPVLASVLVAGVASYSVLMIRIVKPVAGLDEQARKAWNENWDDFASAVHQIESVKQAASEQHEIGKIERNYLGTARELWRSLDVKWSSISYYQHMIVFLTQLAVFLVSVRYIFLGELSVGELIALNGYAMMFFGPFVQMGYNWEVIQNGMNRAAHLRGFWDEQEEVYEPKSAVQLKRIEGAVRFENVSFEYAGGQQGTLFDVNFSVSPGESVAFVGPSGVGKSTAISLISAYHFPTSGHVLIDGADTRELSLTQLRSHIAVVPQEIALFNDTILNNIRYGSFDATDNAVKRAAEDAHIAEFIESLPDKYETVVGERGMKLSVGQKQRIAIARAILRNPAILILDEPTSALDAKTEQQITESLEKLMQGRTTFIIAHRLSTVRKADKILVFESGRIVETGTHDELIQKRDGVYRKLYEYQIGLH